MKIHLYTYVSFTLILISSMFSNDSYAGIVELDLSGQLDIERPDNVYKYDLKGDYVDTNGGHSFYAETAANTTKNREWVSSTASQSLDINNELWGASSTTSTQARNFLYYSVDLFGYTFENRDLEVPIFMDWNISLDLSGSGSYLSSGSAKVVAYSDPRRDMVTHVIYNDGVMSGTDSFIMNDTFSTLYFILSSQVSAQLFKETESGSYSYAKAYADPVLYIDPTWEHADKFSLSYNVHCYDIPTVSIDSSPVSGKDGIDVPEPSTYILFFSVLLGMAGHRFSRRKTIHN